MTKLEGKRDKLVAELKKQQQDEVDHRDWCTDELAAAPQCAALLLRAKAEHGACDGHGVQPLHAASAVGSLECVRQLLRHRAHHLQPRARARR